MTDTTEVVVESASLFSFLNYVAVFIRESYKCMHLWEKVSEDRRNRRLAPIGETRWLAKDQALSKVFGLFGKPEHALFTALVITMKRIEEDDTMKPVVRFKARGHVEAVVRYETILTAQIFLRIFEVTFPVSKYLQTSGMDILTAQRLITGTEHSLRKCSGDFDGVKEASDIFVQWANNTLQEQDDCDVEVQTALPEKCTRKKKTMPGEVARDEPVLDVERNYNIKVHNVILDTITDSIHCRFAASAVLCSDFACMDLRNFPEIRDKGLPKTALEELSKCLAKFDERATIPTLQAELTSRANQLETLKIAPLSGYKVRRVTELSEDTLRILKSAWSWRTVDAPLVKTFPYAAITSCIISTCSQMPTTSLVSHTSSC